MTGQVNEIINNAEKEIGTVLEKPVRDKIGEYFEYLLERREIVDLMQILIQAQDQA